MIATQRMRALRRLTFELSRAMRQTALAARRHDDLGRSAARAGCRSASALERGVRLHSARTAYGAEALMDSRARVAS